MGVSYVRKKFFIRPKYAVRRYHKCPPSLRHLHFQLAHVPPELREHLRNICRQQRLL